MVFLPVHDR